MKRILSVWMLVLACGAVWGQEVKYDLEKASGDKSKAIRFTSESGDRALIYSENYEEYKNRFVFETQDDGDQDYFVFRNAHWSEGKTDVFTIRRNYANSYAKFRISRPELTASETAYLRLTSPKTVAELRMGLNSEYAWIQSYGSKHLRINELGNNTVLNLNGGCVGIGTDDPISKVDIKGNVSTGKSPYTQIQLVTSGWGASHGLLFNAYMQGDGYITHKTKYASDAGSYYNGAGAILFEGNGGNLDFFISPTSKGAGEQVVWGTSKLRIKRSGDVGIGTTDPKAKLDVAGNIKAHEIEVTLAAMQDLKLNGTLAANNITYTANGNTADFVFEDSYQLRELSEVESFIKTNRHLPDIPSAAEMEESGVNLAEMNKLLLQKVEELTLYTIELEKRDKEMSDERKAMKNEMEELRKMVLELAKTSKPSL